MAAVRIDIPASVKIPMSMHIGAPANPVVAVGDSVKVGQLIGEAQGFVSSPVYSSVSGTVKKIEDMVFVGGNSVKCVLIECDGKQEIYEDITPPVINSHDDFLAALKNSGLVGLGGAGFPTHVKLAAEKDKIDAIVINGAECEPYITSDTRTMLDEAEYVAHGIELIAKYLEVDNVVFGIEKNKPECISRMREATAHLGYVRIKPLPSVYPQGGEKVLVYNTLGRIIGEGELPLNQGVIVINCTTLAILAKFVETGMPLIEKRITVDGSAVKEPKNVIVPIGTSVSDVFEFCGGFSEKPEKLLYGGPMMGVAIVDMGAPVLKQTNALLAFGKKEATLPRESACIRCGKCLNTCPLSLSPCEIAEAYEARDAQGLEKLKVGLCMECGCCSYICPAKRPLVQTNKLAKAFLRNQNAKKGDK